jgi:lysyl-tRNA synthetase class 2
MKKDLIVLRSQVVKSVRRFFDARDFLEVQTPRLVSLPGQEPYLEPMWSEVTEAGGSCHKMTLITSPEYAMKRLLADGFDKIYDLGPCFRNGEPWDGSHDPEFLMCEWYEKGVGLLELMNRTEEMVKFVVGAVGAQRAVPLPQGPFRRLTVAEAMKQYADIDLDSLLGDREAMADVCRAHHQTVNENDTWDDLFFKIFLSEVESKLGWVGTSSVEGTRRSVGAIHELPLRGSPQPTFLYRYPASMAALAKRDPDDSRYALRTELYIGDLELCNGFVELSDPIEQRKRFEEERALRSSLGKETWPIDERFLEALPKMGEAAGVAFGVDRLAMLIAETDSISDLMPISARERF